MCKEALRRLREAAPSVGHVASKHYRDSDSAFLGGGWIVASGVMAPHKLVLLVLNTPPQDLSIPPCLQLYHSRSDDDLDMNEEILHR